MDLLMNQVDLIKFFIGKVELFCGDSHNLRNFAPLICPEKMIDSANLCGRLRA